MNYPRELIDVGQKVEARYYWEEGFVGFNIEYRHSTSVVGKKLGGWKEKKMECPFLFILNM